MKNKRTDIHRPGFLKPTEYVEILCFAFPGGDGTPGIGLDYLESMRTGRPVRMHQGDLSPNLFVGADGKPMMVHCDKEQFFKGGYSNGGGCDICGAHFRQGSVFKHQPTGECIIVGHICAVKLGLESDEQAFVKIKGQLREASLRVRERRNRWSRYREILKDKEVRRLLHLDHHIAKDIRGKVRHHPKWGVSSNQVTLLKKIEADLAAPKEVMIQAIVGQGRQTIQGTVVSAKVHDSDYGSQIKITVKMTTSAGSWLAWGTAPSALLDDAYKSAGGTMDGTQALRGAVVRFDAQLLQGRDAHFAIFKRPTQAVLVTPSPEASARNQKHLDLQAQYDKEKAAGAAPEVLHAIAQEDLANYKEHR